MIGQPMKLQENHFVQLPEGYTDVAEYVDELTEFIDAHAYLWNHHAVDFYAMDFWNRHLPEHFRPLAQLSFDELLKMASYGDCPDFLPEQVKTFVRMARSMPLPRDPSSNRLIGPFLSSKPELDKMFKERISQKKQHEIDRLASFIAQVGRQSQTNKVMDLGAGQGYLDHCLAFQHNMDVVAVDDDEHQTQGAKAKTEAYIKKCKGNSHGKIYHVQRFVNPHESFDSVIDTLDVQDTESLKISSDEDGSKWILCGLHTCGDLAVNMLRQFLSGSATTLINVGCCYNHVSEATDIDAFKNRDWELNELWTARKESVIEPGFPLSHHLKNRQYHLGFNGRMLACQNVLKWSDTTQVSNEIFVKHYYRALLQALLYDQQVITEQDNVEVIVGKLPRDAFKQGFAHYAKAALRQVRNITHSFDLDSDEFEQLTSACSQKFKGREMEIAVVWTLRALMADAIESLILMDRYQYLVDYSENVSSLHIWMVPLFEQVLSPRNMVICARKDQC